MKSLDFPRDLAFLFRFALLTSLLCSLFCLLLLPLVHAESSFSSFINRSAEQIVPRNKLCREARVCTLALPLPPEASSKLRLKPHLYFSRGLYSQATLLAGLDILMELVPIGIDANYRSHAQLGQVKEIFLKKERIRIYAKSSGEVYSGNERSAKFLTLIPIASVKKGNLKTILKYAEYLESFSIATQRRKKSLRVAITGPKIWKKKGPLSRVVLGVEISGKRGSDAFLSQLTLLQTSKQAPENLEVGILADGKKAPSGQVQKETRSLTQGSAYPAITAYPTGTLSSSGVKPQWRKPVLTKNTAARKDATLALAAKARFTLEDRYSYQDPLNASLRASSVATPETKAAAQSFLDTLFRAERAWSPMDLDILEYFVTGEGKQIPIALGTLLASSELEKRKNLIPAPPAYVGFPGCGGIPFEPVRPKSKVCFGLSFHELPSPDKQRISPGVQNTAGLNETFQLFKFEASQILDARIPGYLDQAGTQNTALYRRFFRIFRANIWALDGDVEAAYQKTDFFIRSTHNDFRIMLPNNEEARQLAASKDYPYLLYQILERLIKESVQSGFDPSPARILEYYKQVLSEYKGQAYVLTPVGPPPPPVVPPPVQPPPPGGGSGTIGVLNPAPGGVATQTGSLSPSSRPSASVSPQVPSGGDVSGEMKCEVLDTDIDLLEGKASEHAGSLYASNDCVFTDIRLSTVSVVDAPKVSVIPPGLGPIQLKINAEFPSFVDVRFTNRPSWYGHKKNPPLEDICYNHPGKYIMQVVANLKHEGTGKEFKGLRSNIRVFVRAGGWVDFDDSATIHRIGPVPHYKFDIPDQRTCCVELEDFDLLIDTEVIIETPKDSQYYKFIKAEENFHAQQLLGKVPLSRGGRPSLQEIKGAVMAYLRKRNEHRVCKKMLFKGNPQRMCPSAEREMDGHIHAMYKKLEKSLASYGEETRCWIEYTAKREVGLTVEKGAFHYECAYQDCPRNITQPEPWKFG